MKKALLIIILIVFSQSLMSQVYVGESTLVVLENSVNLSIGGDLRHEGRFLGSGQLKLIGDQAQSISGEGLIEHFNIDKGSGQVEVTNGNQDVFRTFEIHGGAFSPNGRLTLKSNDTLTAQMGINTGGSITGDFIIEHFIPKSNRAFRYFSSPVSTSGPILDNLQEGQHNTGTNYPTDNIDNIAGFGTHITGSKSGNNGFDATLSGNSSLFSWNEGPQSWSAFANTNIEVFDKGESFTLLIRGDRSTNLNSNTAIGPETTLRLTGNPAILGFTKQVNLITDNSFILLSNPYHSSIDANSIMNNNPKLNESFIYVYDPTLNTRGGYATVELPAGTNAQGSDANQFIQPWQAVFVEAKNTGATSISINYTENYKDISQLQPSSFNQESRIDVLLQSNNKTIDATSLKLKAGANSEVDLKDAKKFQNYDESLSIYAQGRYLSIEERGFPEEIDTIMLSLKNKRKGAYQFKVNPSNVSETDMVLKDFYLDLEYPINEGEFTVDYQVAEGEPDLRYGFIIESNSLSNEDTIPQNFKVYPNPVNDKFNIQVLSSSSESYSFSIYSLLGQKVDAGQFKSTTSPFSYDASSLSTGVYLVTIIGENNQKEIVKLIKL
jgi:cold shock CspA family protein